jgi:hypothetical protein
VDHLYSISRHEIRPTSEICTSYQSALEAGGEKGVNIFTEFFSTIAPIEVPPLPHHSDSARVPPTPQHDTDRELATFCSFLQAAFAVATATHANTSPTQDKITSNRDRYLPFRQLGPSKRVVLQDLQSPFSPDKLKTRGGFFDALLFRLITQSSPFLVDQGHVRFGSLECFREAVKGLQVDFYCVKNATGRYNRTFNIGFLETYWAQSDSWEGLSTTPELSLESLFSWFTGTVSGKKRFPGMGPLVGWLLASDYAYAGLVPMPSVSDVGRLIYKIDAGGKAGLELLGLKVGDIEACANSLQLVWDGVKSNFTTDEIANMGLEPITLEHALCKYKRIYGTISKVCGAVMLRVLHFTYHPGKGCVTQLTRRKSSSF